jgi:hypothetical protein
LAGTLRPAAEVAALLVFFDRTRLIGPSAPYHRGSLLGQAAAELRPCVGAARAQVSGLAARALALPRLRRWYLWRAVDPDVKASPKPAAKGD